MHKKYEYYIHFEKRRQIFDFVLTFKTAGGSYSNLLNSDLKHHCLWHFLSEHNRRTGCPFSKYPQKVFTLPYDRNNAKVKDKVSADVFPNSRIAFCTLFCSQYDISKTSITQIQTCYHKIMYLQFVWLFPKLAWICGKVALKIALQREQTNQYLLKTSSCKYTYNKNFCYIHIRRNNR